MAEKELIPPLLERQSSSMLRTNSNLEKKMMDMRERFRMLQLMEEIEGKDDTNTNVDSPAGVSTKTSARPTSASPSPVPPQNLAAMRWHKLRKVVRTHSNLQTTSKSEYDSPRSARLESDDEDTKGAKQDSKEDLDDDYSISRPSSSRASRPTSAKGSRPPSGKYKSKRSAKKLEQEDQQLADIWSKDSFFQPYEYDKVAQPDLTLPPIPISDIELKFEEDAEPLKLEISRVPEPAIQEKKDTIEKGLFAQHQANIDTIKKLQTDVIWREDLARKRVIEMENVTKERILIEKSKMIKSALDREKNMGQQFRKAREELEEGIRRQEAAVKEHFGRVLVHNESLARRFFVFTKMFPQPIEFRIHLMRAVKDKLPKGAYVLMLTQYDRLGGNPLVWSEIGANGIGKMRPGITKIVRHQGRYYDRVVRFEDSCFALCPPRPRIKPGYIFVLELFQLASHKNPHDKIVAWSAIPMSYESMNIIEGKFKLPMLRGEHTAKIQHFREMESSIASDLSNWLCNIYIEVRHMSLHELGATEEMLKSADFDLDYFNKTVLSDSYLKNHNAALAANKGEVKTFGTEKHKEVIANSPFTPIDLVLPPSASEDVLFQRRQFSNENTRDEELDELDRLEKQIIKEEQDEAGKEKKNAQQKKGKKESEGGLDEQDGVPLLQLPVDKGIFRRKVHQSIDTARDTEGAGGANVSSANYSHSSVSGQPNHSATYSDDEEQQKKNKKAGKGYDNRTASFLDSWLIMVGLKKRAQETAFRSADSQQRLQSNDSFLEHKKQLLKKWKENVEKKFPKHNSPTHEDEYNKDEVVDIRERGYHLQDEAFLHKHQRGKLMGLETIEKRDNRQWAQATLEGKIVRKWQSDGPRFDTEAIRNGKKGDNEVSPRDDGPPSPLRGYYSPRSGKKRFFAEAPMQGAGRAKGETDGIHEDDAESRDFDDNWEELRDPREMQDYQMSIVADPTSRKNLIPGAIAASKIRYLTQELFGDLVPTSFGTFEFYMTILLYLFTFWMRIYVHYLAQYLYILAQSTPVYSFSLHLLFIMFKYSSSSISEAVEVGIVAIGPVANICVFLVMAMFGSAFYKFSGFLPDAFSKLFAYYGVATILDPVLTILVDVCYGHYACFDHSTICAEDYTSAECDCYNGDFVKLWYRVETKEGTGLTGLFITIMIYLGTGVLSCLILHEYLLHVHRDGRILDLWRRVNAPMEEFFIPDDYEISAEELTKILNAARSFKGVLPGVIIKRNIVFHEGIEKDPNDPNFLASYKRIIIYQNESSGKQFIFRHFLMDHTGKITEIFNDSNLKASDLLPKRAFQGLINKDANTNSNTDGVAAAATGGTIALPPDSSKKSEKDKEGREEKENDERPKSNGSERKTVIKVSANPNSDEVVTNPMVPSLKNMPTSYPPSGSVPSSARSIGRNLPTPSNPLPRGLLPPSQLSSHLNSANVSPRADQNELEDMDGDLDMDLLPKEEDYQHQEELIKQKRKQLKLRDEVELGDDYYNEDRYENDDDEDDYDQGGIDDEEALLANQPKVAQKKKFSPLRKMIKQPNK